MNLFFCLVMEYHPKKKMTETASLRVAHDAKFPSFFIRLSLDGTYYVMALSVRRPSEFVRALIPDPLCRFKQ
jgi:hypothetical protein